jgi:hypothetical protein
MKLLRYVKKSKPEVQTVLCFWDEDLGFWMPVKRESGSRCGCFGVERLDCQSCHGYDWSKDADGNDWAEDE